MGAGISGLTTGYALQKSGISTLVLEAGPRPGGVIQSELREGFLIECGPQSFSGNASVTSICSDLGILDQRLLADSKAPRFVLIDGRLQNVPMGPVLIDSSFFSRWHALGGSARSFGLKPGRRSRDESVGDFARRNSLRTFLERLVGAIRFGIYAGDPEKLSLRAAFPILYEAEKLPSSHDFGERLRYSGKSARPSTGMYSRRTKRLHCRRSTRATATLIQALAKNLKRSDCCVMWK